MNQCIDLQTRDQLRFMSNCSSRQFISSPQDFLDILALGGENGTNAFVLAEENFAPQFYDLKTGLAGEILQKLANYSARLAIVGTFDKIGSERFRELMSESNKGRLVRFATHKDEAIAWLMACL